MLLLLINVGCQGEGDFLIVAMVSVCCHGDSGVPDSYHGDCLLSW